MDAVRVEMTVDADGELHLTDLPCRRGDKVEAIIRVLNQAPDADGGNAHNVVVASSPNPPGSNSQNIEAKFRALAKRWREETEIESSITRMTRHPDYQEIISMGPAVVPLILAELKRRPDFWFAALRTLTGVDPVPKAAEGKIKQMTRAWLEWGRKQGHIQ